MKKLLSKLFLFLSFAFVAYGNIFASESEIIEPANINQESFGIKNLSQKISEAISNRLENKIFGVKFGYVSKDGAGRSFTLEETEKSGIKDEFRITDLKIDKSERDFEITLAPQNFEYTLVAKGKFTESKKIIVAGDLIKKGEEISEDKIAYKYLPEEKVLFKGLNDLSLIIGKIATKNISLSSQILEGDVENPIIIKKGKAVVAVYRSKNMEVKVTSVALADGREGEVIRLKNIESGKEFLAMAEKQNTAIVNFADITNQQASNEVKNTLLAK